MCHNRTGLGHFHDTMVSQNSSAWWLPCLVFKAYSLPESLQEYWWYLGHLKKTAVRSMRHETSWDVEKIHPGKLYSHADSTGRFHWCRPQLSLRLKCLGLQNRRSRADLRCGSKRAFAIASFPGIRSVFFAGVQLNAIKMSNCYQLSYVIKYYELWLGNFGLLIQELSNEITRLTEAMSNRCHPCISRWFRRKFANFA